MALVRWEPFREIDTLQRQMNRLFDELIPLSARSDDSHFLPSHEDNQTEQTRQKDAQDHGQTVRLAVANSNRNVTYL